MISGTTALVIEDEYIIALEVQRILEAAGCATVIAAADAADSIAPAGKGVDLAVVAVPPDRPHLVELCQSLSDRGIALVVLTSGLEASGTPLAGAFMVRKPFPDHELMAAATAALESRSRRSGAIS